MPESCRLFNWQWSTSRDFVMIDERLGRRAADALGLPIAGTVGVLLAAYRAGLIDRGQVIGAVEAMTESGIRLAILTGVVAGSGVLGSLHPALTLLEVDDGGGERPPLAPA